MNYSSNRHEFPFSENNRTIHRSECKTCWILPDSENTGLVSISVFGTLGSRYSILVIEKEHLRSDFAGRDGRWFLTKQESGAVNVLFRLEWVLEAEGTGCFVLCGKEAQNSFCSSA